MLHEGANPSVRQTLRTLSDAVHRAGAAISIQLTHGGGFADPAVVRGGRTVAPSSVFNPVGPRADTHTRTRTHARTRAPWIAPPRRRRRCAPAPLHRAAGADCRLVPASFTQRFSISFLYLISLSNARMCPVQASLTFPAAMAEADFVRVAADFAQAARLCKECGFDAVELHAGHG